ncbi:metal cation symporter ZIP14-like [Artemia franciscana]|uniref:Zinc transporter ZIP14 n=1 Tax=Artemia franciscana TaxID=6661 RepID=A0AA88I1R2_ARTSF|nr:hypothetical protein QYM36_002713 [Artemia franciscana]
MVSTELRCVLCTFIVVHLSNYVTSIQDIDYTSNYDSIRQSVIQQFKSDEKFEERGFRELVHVFKNRNRTLALNQVLKRKICEQNEDCISQNCFDEDALWKYVVNSVEKNGPDTEVFSLICPVLLLEKDLRYCHQTDEPLREYRAPVVTVIKAGVPSAKVWGYGFLFVTMISLCSLVGVSVLPLMRKTFYNNLLTAMVGLAVGSLFGSSVFHLIPQAYGIMDPEFDPDHVYLNKSLLIFAGFWLFFMIERTLKIIMEVKERKSNFKRKNHNMEVNGIEENHQLQALDHTKLDDFCVPIPPGDIYESQEQAIKASFGHREKPKKHHHGHEHFTQIGEKNAIATVAWMIVFGDGLHNFIDGLSIGAGFSESINTGISISVAVLCEELPHELGDFAVLLASGMSMKQALWYNFLSACTCYVGLAVGIMLGEVEASVYIFALAGGMFLYISLTDMVPELNEVAEEASKESLGSALKVLSLQNLGIFIGIAALYTLAKFQDSIQISF